MPREREGNECTSSEGETESEADREAETKRKKKKKQNNQERSTERITTSCTIKLHTKNNNLMKRCPRQVESGAQRKICCYQNQSRNKPEETQEATTSTSYIEQEAGHSTED